TRATLGHGARLSEWTENPPQSTGLHQLPALPRQRHAGAVKGTDNLYLMPAFLHAGLSCERCHGPGSRHSAGAAGAIVNPSRLPPDRRDAVCMQCHLEGKVAIERPGRRAYDFQPGDSLSDYIRYYVLAGSQVDGLRGVSQVEAL